MPEGANKLKQVDNQAQMMMDTTGLKGRQNVQAEVDVLRTDWEDFSCKLTSLKESLEQALHYWGLYESSYQQMSGWLKAMEKQIKDCPLKSTLSEKQEHLTKYQVRSAIDCCISSLVPCVYMFEYSQIYAAGGIVKGYQMLCIQSCSLYLHVVAQSVLCHL